MRYHTVAVRWFSTIKSGFDSPYRYQRSPLRRESERSREHFSQQLPTILNMLRGQHRAPGVQVLLNLGLNRRSVEPPNVRALEGVDSGHQLVTFGASSLQLVKQRLEFAGRGDGLGEPQRTDSC
jgi:hypothetical protein